MGEFIYFYTWRIVFVYIYVFIRAYSSESFRHRYFVSRLRGDFPARSPAGAGRFTILSENNSRRFSRILSVFRRRRIPFHRRTQGTKRVALQFKTLLQFAANDPATKTVRARAKLENAQSGVHRAQRERALAGITCACILHLLIPNAPGTRARIARRIFALRHDFISRRAFRVSSLLATRCESSRSSNARHRTRFTPRFSH
jgi:hypothetical protein